MSNITSADATIVLAAAGLFSGTEIQGWTADDIFDVADVTTAETIMGLDGVLSFAWIPVSKTLTFSLMAGSLSLPFLDIWIDTEETLKRKFTASGVITLPAVGKVYSPSGGCLKSYTPISAAKKYLQPRKFVFEFQSLNPASL